MDTAFQRNDTAISSLPLEQADECKEDKNLQLFQDIDSFIKFCHFLARYYLLIE